MVSILRRLLGASSRSYPTPRDAEPEPEVSGGLAVRIALASLLLVLLGLALSSLGLLVAAGVIAGLGQGLAFRHGLVAINAASPPDRRGEVASSFFLVAYLAISLPVIGVGVVAEVTGLRAAGLIFAATIAALAAAVVLLIRRPTEGHTS